MTPCPNCERQVPVGAKFCAECGTKLPQACGRCGTPATAGAKFCTECGAPLAPDTLPRVEVDSADADDDGAERRQLTVGFCDLVGSTELATRLDPEDLRELNRAYRTLCADTIRRYDGYVAKYMGDGILAYFGYPRAHEDDAARAVRAGLEIASAVPELAAAEWAAQPLAVRVGIATGPVVVGELVGEGAARERDVVGETPNLAARLQGLADANAVVVGEDTRKLLGAAFELEDLGVHALKGFADPVAAWRVVGTAAVDSRFEATRSGGLTPFVGREHETGLVMDCWRQAVEGEGRVVLLRGEPGIGKSRIIQSLRGGLGDTDYVAVRCQCSPYHQSSALYPFAEQLERAAGFTHGDTSEARLDKLEQLIELPDHARAETLALFASLLSIPCEDRYPALDLDPEVLRERTLDAIANGLQSLARERPLLVLVEDVHWADPTTLALLDRLVERCTAWRALMLITFRPEFDARWDGQAHVALVSLSRLDRRRCEAMIATLTEGKALPEALVEQITLKTDGVPLFVEELTKTILESGLVTEQVDRYALSGPMQRLAIPATLQDSLMARLDQLGDAKAVAQTGSAIGREFAYQLLAAVVERSPSDLARSLSRLTESGLLFRRSAGTGTSYVFKHALVQDAAYNSLLKSRRYVLHERIAKALKEHFPEIERAQPELLAQHYASAGLDREALPYWRRAGRRAMERSAHLEAISHFRRGLDRIADIESEPAGAEQAVEFRTSIAECLRIVDRIDEAFKMLEQAQDIALRHDLARHLARVHHQRGNLYFPMAKIDECLGEHQRSLEHARSASSIEDEVRALGGLGDAYYVRGQMRTAYEYFVRCVALAREHGFAKTEAANLSMRGFSRGYLLELREALCDGLDAAAMAVEAGHPRARLLGETMAAWVMYYTGDFPRAEEHSRLVIVYARRRGARRFEPQNLYYQALSLHRQGQRHAAMALLDEAESIARQFSPGFSLPRVLGGIALVTDDPARRDRALDETERLLEAGAVSHNYFIGYLDAIDACLEPAQWDRMEHYADRLEAYTRAEPLPWSDLVITRGRALAAWGRGDRGAGVLEQLRRVRDQAMQTGWLSILAPLDVILGSTGADSISTTANH